MPVYKKISPISGKLSWYTQFYYTDWMGKQHKKKKEGFKKKGDAKDYEQDFLDRINAAPDMLFSSLVSIYMEDLKSRVKPTTYHTKEKVIYRHVLPYFKDMRINEITPAAVRHWQGELLKDSQIKADTYQHNIHAQLSAIFNYAVKFYQLRTNPARLAGSIGSMHADSIHFWTAAQFAAFTLCIGKRLIYLTAFSLLFWTGCRIGELLALTPADFDLMGGTMNITKTYIRIKGKGCIQDPKTRKSRRTVTLPPFLVLIVQDWIFRADLAPHDRLFEGISQTSTERMLHKVAKAACLPPIRVHDLRHSHASMLIELGFSPLLIAERLGHEDIQTTLRTYSHLYPNKQNELAAKLQQAHF